MVRVLALGLALACMCLSAQVVQESFARDPGPLDFIRGEGFEQAILQALTGDSLVGMDAQGRLVPRLADRWVLRGRSLRLHLRKDACFEDGTPVRIEDALWTIRTLQSDPGASPTKRSLLAGLRARILGDALDSQGSALRSACFMSSPWCPSRGQAAPARAAAPSLCA